MAAGVEKTRAAISPGSTEYGERGALEANLGAAMGGGAGPAAGGGGAPRSIRPPATDPLGALLSGAIKAPSAALTDGLSVGPGAGPANAGDPMLSDYAERLRVVALQAASPMLREAARRRLARMTKGA